MCSRKRRLVRVGIGNLPFGGRSFKREVGLNFVEDRYIADNKKALRKIYPRSVVNTIQDPLKINVAHKISNGQELAALPMRYLHIFTVLNL